MRNTKTIPTCKEKSRRENDDDSDRRGKAIVAVDSYPDLAKGCVVDRGWGRFGFFLKARLAVRRWTKKKTT